MDSIRQLLFPGHCGRDEDCIARHIVFEYFIELKSSLGVFASVGSGFVVEEDGVGVVFTSLVLCLFHPEQLAGGNNVSNDKAGPLRVLDLEVFDLSGEVGGVVLPPPLAQPFPPLQFVGDRLCQSVDLVIHVLVEPFVLVLPHLVGIMNFPERT